MFHAGNGEDEAEPSEVEDGNPVANAMLAHMERHKQQQLELYSGQRGGHERHAATVPSAVLAAFGLDPTAAGNYVSPAPADAVSEECAVSELVGPSTRPAWSTLQPMADLACVAVAAASVHNTPGQSKQHDGNAVEPAGPPTRPARSTLQLPRHHNPGGSLTYDPSAVVARSHLPLFSQLEADARVAMRGKIAVLGVDDDAAACGIMVAVC
jgi:hypothetical protein